MHIEIHGGAMLLIFVKIACAAIGYALGTVGIRYRGINTYTAGVFSIAFACDLWATYDMYALNPNAPLTLHSIIGIVALIFAALLETAILIGIGSKARREKVRAIFQMTGLWFLLVWFITVFLGITVVALRHALALHGAS